MRVLADELDDFALELNEGGVDVTLQGNREDPKTTLKESEKAKRDSSSTVWLHSKKPNKGRWYKMIGILKSLLSQAGITGMVVGAIAMYFLKPLVDAGIVKIIRKNV